MLRLSSRPILQAKYKPLAQKIRRYGIAHKRRISFLSPFILQKAFSFCKKRLSLTILCRKRTSARTKALDCCHRRCPGCFSPDHRAVLLLDRNWLFIVDVPFVGFCRSIRCGLAHRGHRIFLPGGRNLFIQPRPEVQPGLIIKEIRLYCLHWSRLRMDDIIDINQPMKPASVWFCGLSDIACLDSLPYSA